MICNECGRRATGTSPELGPLCDACATAFAPPVPRCHDCGQALGMEGLCFNGCDPLDAEAADAE
jgi:predicted amidophosphoribosyltransferase